MSRFNVQHPVTKQWRCFFHRGRRLYHGLYEQRMILFAALVKAYKDKAWKSYRHEDGEYCFGGGWFIVGIDTPEGSYTYHYENKYWDMFVPPAS